MFLMKSKVKYSWVIVIWTQFLLSFLVHNIYFLKMDKKKKNACKNCVDLSCTESVSFLMTCYRHDVQEDCKNLFNTWILSFQNNVIDIPMRVLPVISSRLPMKVKMNFTDSSCVSMQCTEVARQVTVSAKSCLPTAAGRPSCLAWPRLRTGARLTVFGLPLRVSAKWHQCWQRAGLSRALSQPGTAPY